jgi:hypothetical protein
MKRGLSRSFVLDHAAGLRVLRFVPIAWPKELLAAGELTFHLVADFLEHNADALKLLPL